MRVVSVIVLLALLGLQGCGGSPSDGADPTAHSASASASATATWPGAPSLTSPATLAAQIARAEVVVADGSSSADAVRQAGEFEQLADRLLAGTSARMRKPVLARLSGRARAVTRANLAAAGGLTTLTPPQPHLPKWRIVAPLTPEQLMGLYRSAQRRTGVPWQYLAAINFVETKFGRIVGPSYAGAQGPMQFMPATWARYGHGGDVDDPRDAIPAAARLLRANGAPGDIAGALRHYNNSSSYVTAVTSYARVMKRWPRAMLGYLSWRVLYHARSGVYVLPVGYPATKATRIE